MYTNQEVRTASTTPTRPWFRPRKYFLIRKELDDHPVLARINLHTFLNDFGDTMVSLSGSEKEQRNVRWLKARLRDYLGSRPEEYSLRGYEGLYLSENETLLDSWDLFRPFIDYVTPLVPRSTKLFWRSAVWLGLSGTRTGLHADPDGYNLLCQIFGTKRVWLLDSSAARNVTVNSRFDFGARTTDIDFWSTDISEIVESRSNSILLQRGDILFIPRWQWHAAENLDTSLAFSFRAESPYSLFLNLPVELRHLFHNLGFYKRNNCTCHPLV